MVRHWSTMHNRCTRTTGSKKGQENSRAFARSDVDDSEGARLSVNAYENCIQSVDLVQFVRCVPCKINEFLHIFVSAACGCSALDEQYYAELWRAFLFVFIENCVVLF